MTDKQIIPLLEDMIRPIIVNGKKVTTEELAWLGKNVIVAVANGEVIDKEFVKGFIKFKNEIYKNPENVDFGEFNNDR